MTLYTTRAIEVEAVRYDGQQLKDLPAWVTSHAGDSAFGVSGIGRNLVGELLVPIAGRTETVRLGDYLVRKSGAAVVAKVMRRQEFEALHEVPEEVPERPFVAAVAPEVDDE